MHHAPRSEINVTPLVDVVLVLLIVFMVATPLLRTGYEAQVPATSSDLPPKPGTIVVSLTNRHEIYLDKERVAASDLTTRLRALLQNRGHTVVFFSGSDTVDYGEGMDVMDAVRASGGSVGLLMEAISPE